MFQLYRIYDLKPVKYENLRPEKVSKGRVAAGGVNDDTLEDDDAGPSPTKKTRTPRKGTKNVKAGAQEQDADAIEKTTTETPSKTPKKRARKVKMDTEHANPPAPPHATPVKKCGRTTKKSDSSQLRKEDLDCLLNQEEMPVPVDGALLEVVEAEEHPEAASAVEEGQNLGCAAKNLTPRKKAST